jgi:hypothetical protein
MRFMVIVKTIKPSKADALPNEEFLTSSAKVSRVSDSVLHSLFSNSQLSSGSS